MKFKIKSKIILSTGIAFAVMLSFCVFLHTASVRAQSRPEASISLGYSYDFSSAVPGSSEWQADTWQSQGLYISPMAPVSLISGIGDNNVLATGYVTYKVEAGAAKVFSGLRLIMSGRVFHYMHASDCKDCKLSIYAGAQEGALSLVQTVYATDDGQSSVKNYDLSEAADGHSALFIKIEMSGYAYNWVNIEKVMFEGETRYDGYDFVDIAITDRDAGNAVSLGSTVPLKQALASTVGGAVYDIIKSVTTPDGEVLGNIQSSFTADALGVYKVVYTVNDEGRIYTNSYDVYCVKNAQVSGFATANGEVWDNGRMQDVSNYLLDSEDALSLTDEGVKIDGTANYLLPIDFSGRFNLLFDIHSLKVGEAIEIALTGQPGAAQFDTKATPGIYFVIKNEGNKLFTSGYFSSGSGITGLGASHGANITGTHGLGFVRRTSSYADGLEIYLDGEQFAAYHTAVSVTLSSFMKENNVYLSCRTVKAQMELIRVVKSDVRNPVLTVVEKDGNGNTLSFATTGEAGGKYVLPLVKMIDAIDGDMPYSVEVIDPNDNIAEILTDGDNRQYFNLVYEGRYRIFYKASDYSGNVANTVRNVSVRLKDGAPNIRLSSSISSFGRVGVAFKLPKASVLIGGAVTDIDVKVVVIRPSGTNLAVTGDEFIPSNTGVYTVIYSASNDVATTYLYYETSIKENVFHEDSYRDVMSADSWAGGNVFTETESGLKLYGDAYCRLPFEMTNGIEIELDLTELIDKVKDGDSWVSIGIGNSPAMGNFMTPSRGSVVIMMYMQDQTYYANAVYCASDGAIYGLLSESIGTSGKLILSINKLSGTGAHDDNVNFYINHKRIDYETIRTIAFSSLVDNENFSYLSFYAYGNLPIAAELYKAATLTRVGICDQIAPQFNIGGEIPGKITLNQTVVIPDIAVSDNLDGNFKYSIELYSPDGKSVDFSSGSFVADIKGVYYLILKAYDTSGNQNLLIYELAVEEGQGCASALSGAGLMVAAAMLAGAMFVIIKKGRRG